MKLYIKNMACESCKYFVIEILQDLDIQYVKVELGVTETKDDIRKEDIKKFNRKLRTAGMELLESKQAKLAEMIKVVIRDYVYNTDEKPTKKFSILLSEKLNHNYTYLANLFSEVEANTIEQYIISLKVERIKELVIYGEKNFSEIAYMLHYSSVAHLSGQFKKHTGLTPTHFRGLKEKRRLSIQEI